MRWIAEAEERQVLFELCASNYQKHIFQDLQAKDFFSLDNRQLFERLNEAYSHSKATFDSYAATLLSDGTVSSDSNAPLFSAVTRIKNCAMRRDYSMVFEELSRQVNDPAFHIDHAEIANRVAECTANRVAEMPKSFRQALKDARQQRQEARRGMIFGLPDIDNKIWIDPASLVIIAARPSIGKTALALTTLWHNLIDGRQPAFCSMEMQEPELIFRLASIALGIPFIKFQQNLLTPEEERKYDEFEAWLLENLNSDYWLWCEQSLTIQKIRDWAYSVRPNILYIDYAQLINSPGKYWNMSEAERLTLIVNQANSLRMELKIPVVLLAQLNRDTKGVPSISNIKGSGAFEQAGTNIFLIDRPQGDDSDRVDRPYMRRDGVTKLPMWSEAGECTNGVILIGKNRNGVKGYVPVSYESERMIFRDWTEFGEEYMNKSA